MNLLLLEPSEVDPDNVASVDGVRARHLRQVLGAEPGRTVRVGLVDGPLGTGTVLSIDEGHARLACTFDAASPPVPAVDLLLALPRPKVLRRMWAQLAALGVGRIMLTNAARVERNYFDTTVLDPAVYRPLLIEGLQQARDTRVPVVTVHKQFRILIEDDLDGLCPQPMRLIADPDAGAGLVPRTPSPSAGQGRHEAGPYATEGGGPCDAVAVGRHGDDSDDRDVGAAPRARPTSDRILLAVGPEGGWNDFERHLLEVHGFGRLSLGPRTLRTDTACIALHAVVMAGAALPSFGVAIAAIAKAPRGE